MAVLALVGRSTAHPRVRRLRKNLRQIQHHQKKKEGDLLCSLN